MRRKNRKGSSIQREHIPEVEVQKLVADEAEMRAHIAPGPRSHAVPDKKPPQTIKGFPGQKPTK